MKPLFTQLEYDNCSSQSKLPLTCYHCHSTFTLTKHQISKVYRVKNCGTVCKYCSKRCQNAAKVKTIKVVCNQCSVEFHKQHHNVARSPKHFCSRSCAATYHNAHKTKGCRRSKIEVWLEQQLKTAYPDIQCLFNEKKAINAELDIYIPSLSLAFELNGIFHYEPIFGKDKLQKIQNNDNRKFQACIENSISLCIIDISTMEYFKPTKAQKYLDIVRSIIDAKLSATA